MTVLRNNMINITFVNSTNVDFLISHAASDSSSYQLSSRGWVNHVPDLLNI